LSLPSNKTGPVVAERQLERADLAGHAD
jgi:hypothetical protein